MKSRELIGVVENGHLPENIRRGIAAFLRQCEGKHVGVSLRLARKRRSGQQNRFYWGVVLPIVYEMFVELGNDVSEDEVHEFLKEHVGKLTKLIDVPDGERRKVVMSSADLSTMEWERFMDRIRAWAAVFGVEIPYPNEELVSSGHAA